MNGSSCQNPSDDNQAPHQPSDAPTDREWREWRNAQTLSAEEWKRYARN